MVRGDGCTEENENRREERRRSEGGQEERQESRLDNTLALDPLKIQF